MKKVILIATLIMLPILIAAGTIVYINNQLSTDTLHFSATGVYTLTFHDEKEELTVNDLHQLYTDQNTHTIDDIIFHYIEGEPWSASGIHYLNFVLELNAEKAGNVMVDFNVPDDMTVQIDYTKVVNGDTFEVEQGRNSIAIFFFFEGEQGELRAGDISIDFGFKMR